MQCNVYDASVKLKIKRKGKARTIAFENLKEGDVILAPQHPGIIVGEDAHFCGDSSYEGYLFHDVDGADFYPEDFGAELESGTADVHETTLSILADLEVKRGQSSDYFLIARAQDENGDALDASVSVAVEDHGADGKLYVIYLSDEINGEDDGETLFHAEFNQQDLEKAISEIATSVMDQYRYLSD